MKTEWDYTTLADAYLKRPDYSDSAIDELVQLAAATSGAPVCDVGAGVAHLTLMLAARGCKVSAVEPNDAMRANGMARTRSLPNVHWHEGTGERTGQPAAAFRLVTFGSSFNVTDRAQALEETARILTPGGWFACMWNHRDLDDPIQRRIEQIIHERVPGYGYGTRREDQTQVIEATRRFGPVHKLAGRVCHRQSVDECVEAWRSHATLARQAGDAFPSVVRAIESYLGALGVGHIEIPYTTNIWASRLVH